VQADTGTKMVHIGKNTRSRIVSKGISAGHSRNCYRGLVQACSLFYVTGCKEVDAIATLMGKLCESDVGGGPRLQ
jgi:hypothetical protein